MNSKQLNIILSAAVVILLSIVGYMALRDNSQNDTLSQQDTTPNSNLVDSNQITPTQKTTQTQADETANWKIQSDPKAGWSFKTPTTWVVGGSFDAYGQPKLTVSVDYISSMPNVCELGPCQPSVNKLKKQIEDSSITGVISFNGGKGLVITGDTLEGAPPINPWYKLIFIRGDEYFTFQLTDYSMVFKSENEATAYLSKIIPPRKVSVSNYQTYNDFITMIEKTLTVK